MAPPAKQYDIVRDGVADISVAPAILSNADAITSLDDLKGFKVLAVGKDKINTWTKLVATPVGGSGQKPFEVVSSGVADGATHQRR